MSTTRALSLSASASVRRSGSQLARGQSRPPVADSNSGGPIRSASTPPSGSDRIGQRSMPDWPLMTRLSPSGWNNTVLLGPDWRWATSRPVSVSQRWTPSPSPVATSLPSGLTSAAITRVFSRVSERLPSMSGWSVLHSVATATSQTPTFLPKW